jgi:tetratricopeptide repeat protein
VQKEMMSTAFENANRLWFDEGRTAAALTAYEEALHETPADPVLAFQLARVLWSMDRFDRARSLLEQAGNNRERLSEGGQSVLEMWAAKLEQPPPERPFPQLTPTLLDRDALEAGAQRDWDWRTIADAASARRMFGLAAYAIEQWKAVPFDAEDAKDIGDIYTNRAMEQNMLTQMYAQAEQPTEPSAVKPGKFETHKSSNVVTSTETARPPASSKRPVETPHQELPTIPLILTVKATPIEGPVGVATTMEASLSNPTDKPYLVNRRMLLNNVNAPGEIWLEVDGPEGYRNTRGFRVRAGKASNEFFVTLGPGESVRQSWNLDDYHSLHVTGDYTVKLTYHNEDPAAPDGRPMAIGKAVGSVRLRRN